MTLKFQSLPQDLARAFGERVGVCVELATQAGSATLGYFQSPDLQVERKNDDSPVTAADRAAEKIIRDELASRFPTDAILGEEFGEGSLNSDAEFRWIIDPIDGTKSFMSGVPLYSTLIGVTQNEQPIIGVILIPALGEIIVAARGLGAWHQKSNLHSPSPQWQRAQVSPKDKLGDALFVHSQVDGFFERGAGEIYSQLEKETYIARSWGDGYGYLLVATGRAEMMLDPIVNPWDVAAVIPVIEEAGGVCVAWNGENSAFGGNMLGCNKSLYPAVREIIERNHSV